jgi:hypothetical protein
MYTEAQLLTFQRAKLPVFNNANDLRNFLGKVSNDQLACITAIRIGHG